MAWNWRPTRQATEISLLATGNTTNGVRNKKLLGSSTVLVLCLWSQMQSCCSVLFNLATYQRIPCDWKSPEPYLLLLPTHNDFCSKWPGTPWKIRVKTAVTTTLCNQSRIWILRFPPLSRGTLPQVQGLHTHPLMKINAEALEDQEQLIQLFDHTWQLTSFCFVIFCSACLMILVYQGSNAMLDSTLKFNGLETWVNFINNCLHQFIKVYMQCKLLTKQTNVAVLSLVLFMARLQQSKISTVRM